jgi:hypothetical protein
MTWHVDNYEYINKFQPKCENDMIKCVAHNKSSLFAPRLKVLEKQGK